MTGTNRALAAARTGAKRPRQLVSREKLAGRPEEVAAAIPFLASPGASYITGTTLDVDGGYNA